MYRYLVNKTLANFVPTGIWRIKTLVKVRLLKNWRVKILVDLSTGEIPYVMHVIANCLAHNQSSPITCVRE